MFCHNLRSFYWLTGKLRMTNSVLQIITYLNCTTCICSTIVTRWTVKTLMLYNIINIKSCIVIKKHTCSGKVDLMLFLRNKSLLPTRMNIIQFYLNILWRKYFLPLLAKKWNNSILKRSIVFNNLLKLIINHQNSFETVNNHSSEERQL